MLSIEALRSLPSVRAAVASPDGKRVAFYYDAAERYELSVLDVESGECTQLGDGDVPSSPRTHLAWSADGEEVLYHHHREPGREDDVYAMDLDGNASPVVVAGGACLLTDVCDRRLLFTRRTDEGRDLYYHDRETAETVRIAADGNVMGAKFSPGGDRAAYTTAESVETADVYVVDLETGSRTGLVIPSREEGVGVRDWAGDELLVESWPVGRPSIGVVRLAEEGHGGLPAVADERWFGSDRHREHPLQFLEPPRDRILGERMTEAGALVPVIYDRGSETIVGPRDGLSDFAGEGYGAALSDGTLLLDYRSPVRKTSLYRYDPDDGARTLLYEPGTEGIDPESFVDAEHVRVELADGPPVGGILYRVGTPDDPAPAVVRVSRRPRSATYLSFDWSTQLLANRGYAVLWVNQRGANRYLGPDQPGLDGELGRGDQRDVAAAAGWLADREWVDEDRIGIVGRRYGGFSAYAQLLDHPDRYACGLAWGGIADLGRLYRDEDAAPAVREGLARWIDGDPEGPEWERRSPIERIDRLDVPLGILHETENAVVPVDQSRWLRRALLDADYREGEDFEYRELESRPDRDRVAEGYEFVLDFLGRRLRDPVPKR